MNKPLEGYDEYDLPVCNNCYSKDSTVVENKVPPADTPCGICNEPAKLYIICRRYDPPGTVRKDDVKDNPLAGTIQTGTNDVESAATTQEGQDGNTTPESS